MADTSMTFSPPLPEQLHRLTITWVKGSAGKEKPVPREQATAALAERTFSSGISRAARYTLQEADALIAEVDRLQGRRPRSSPAPAPRPRTNPTPAPRSAPAPAPAPRTSPSSTTSRTRCSRCGGTAKALGPRHLLLVGSLDGFYGKGLGGADLAVATVYDYECGTCHVLTTFATAR